MKYYVVNAFTDTMFGGNPAGVCLLEKPLEDKVMQCIAMQNNLAETAFLLKSDGRYSLRWFTPEVDLCGHATLATAFVLMTYVDIAMTLVDFHTKSGVLSVVKDNEMFVMDFPSRNPLPCAIPDSLENALGTKVLETHLSRDLLVVVENEESVQRLKPDLSLLSEVDAFAVIVTAKGHNCDFVSRFFAPNAGIPEDPVTGSAHCSLIPFWSKKLGKNKLYARQLSKRGGVIDCENCDERVKIGGTAICYSNGEILI